jgi:hypothetical protein
MSNVELVMTCYDSDSNLDDFQSYNVLSIIHGILFLESFPDIDLHTIFD